MADIAELGFSADTTQLDKADNALKKIPPSAEKAEKAAQGVGRGFGGLSTSIRNSLVQFTALSAANDNAVAKMAKTISSANLLKTAFIGVGSAVAAVAAGLTVKAYYDMADAWSDLSARAGLAVGNMDAAGVVMDRLSDIARGTYSSLSNTVEGFIGVSGSLSELGYSANQSLNFVEGLNNALVVSGAKGQHAQSVMDNLSKAMAVGKLSGIGLETVMSRGSRVATALAKELNVNVNSLRKMAAQGKITSSVIYNALTKEMQTLKDEAASMPATVGDGFQIIANGALQLVGKFDQLSGISESTANGLIMIGDSLKFLADNLPTIAQWSVKAAVGLGLLFAPKIIAMSGALLLSVGKLTVAIGVSLVKALAAASVAMVKFTLSNPFTALAYGIGVALAALYVFRDAIASVIGKDFVNAARDGVNKTIGFFVGGYNAIVATWEQLPKVFSGLGKSAWNAFIDEISPEKNYIESNGIFGKWKIPLTPDLSGLKKTLTDEERALTMSVKDIVGASMNVDWVGKLDDSISSIGETLTISLDKANAFNKAISEGDDKAAKKAKKDFEAILTGVDKNIETLMAESKMIGMSALESAKLKNETDLLNQAREKGLKLTGAQRNQLIALAHGMAEMEIANKKAAETLEFSKSLVGDLFSDLRSGIEQGKSLWQTFGDMALNALNKIVDKLLNDVLDAMFQVSSAGNGSGGGLGGLLGSAIGWLFNAKGNAFAPSGVTAFAKGGSFTNSVVSQPTPFAFGNNQLGVMGEAGHEAVMPLARTSDGSLGVQVANAGRQTADGAPQIVYAPVYTIEAGATQEAVAALERAQAKDRKEFPAMAVKAVNNYQKRNGQGV